MKTISVVILICFAINLSYAQTTDKSVVPITLNARSDAQAAEKYIVLPVTLNMRNGAGTSFDVLNKLKKGDQLTVIEKGTKGWWYMDYEGTQGYVFAELLQKDPYSGWEKKVYQSGVTPECENVTPRYDNELDNFLRINVGSNTDVVVKLMKKDSYADECIRIVYVRSGEIYDIKNIPEGLYYLKIAYGKDYRQKITDGQCYVRFLKNSMYEKGVKILDFHKVKNPDTIVGNSIRQSWTVPSYELMLDVRMSKIKAKTFNSTDISEAQFNN